MLKSSGYGEAGFSLDRRQVMLPMGRVEQECAGDVMKLLQLSTRHIAARQALKFI